MSAQADDLPTIVCLCGSTRFFKAYSEANLQETLAGRIVLSVGSHAHSDAELGISQDSQVKRELDELHLRKIDMCDEVLVLNVDGYIGKSTRKEVLYAIAETKRIRFLEHEAGLCWLRDVMTAAEFVINGDAPRQIERVRTGLDIVNVDDGYEVVHEDRGVVEPDDVA